MGEASWYPTLDFALLVNRDQGVKGGLRDRDVLEGCDTVRVEQFLRPQAVLLQVS